MSGRKYSYYLTLTVPVMFCWIFYASAVGAWTLLNVIVLDQVRYGYWLYVGASGASLVMRYHFRIYYYSLKKIRAFILLMSWFYRVKLNNNIENHVYYTMSIYLKHWIPSSRQFNSTFTFYSVQFSEFTSCVNVIISIGFVKTWFIPTFFASSSNFGLLCTLSPVSPIIGTLNPIYFSNVRIYWVA